jgi:hypothetical protein
MTKQSVAAPPEPRKRLGFYLFFFLLLNFSHVAMMRTTVKRWWLFSSSVTNITVNSFIINLGFTLLGAF